jgi:ubiquinone/menaquinone biosynthesis C-methylase UbiE
MIDDEEYDIYLKGKKTLTECQRIELLHLRTQINTLYVDQKSNIQISTFVKNCKKNRNILSYSNLQLLFNHFCDFSLTDKIFRIINKNNNITDTAIINIIKNNRNVVKNNKNNKNNKNCPEWTYIMENLSKAYRWSVENVSGKYDNENIRYLDIGCASGKKTKRFAKECKILESNIYGTDIKNWGPYDQKNYKHSFNFKYILENGKLDYEDNSFDVVTCFFTLHHIEKLDTTLNEIKRVLKPNGIILILEHDSLTDYDHMIQDILHLMYAYLVDKNNNYIKNPDFSQYYNWAEWGCIFHKKGFEYVKGHYIFSGIGHEIRYDNIYYAFSKNIK